MPQLTNLQSIPTPKEYDDRVSELLRYYSETRGSDDMELEDYLTTHVPLVFYANAAGATTLGEYATDLVQSITNLRGAKFPDPLLLRQIEVPLLNCSFGVLALPPNSAHDFYAVSARIFEGMRDRGVVFLSIGSSHRRILSTESLADGLLAKSLLDLAADIG